MSEAEPSVAYVTSHAWLPAHEAPGAQATTSRSWRGSSSAASASGCQGVRRSTAAAVMDADGQPTLLDPLAVIPAAAAQAAYRAACRFAHRTHPDDLRRPVVAVLDGFGRCEADGAARSVTAAAPNAILWADLQDLRALLADLRHPVLAEERRAVESAPRVARVQRPV